LHAVPKKKKKGQKPHTKKGIKYSDTPAEQCGDYLHKIASLY